MFAGMRRRLQRAALAAAAASLLLAPVALADAEWCEDEPALVVAGQYVSITLVPHVLKANAKQIVGAETILRAPLDSQAQIVPTAGAGDFPEQTYLAPSAPANGGPARVDAVSVVYTSRTPVPVDVRIVVTNQSSGASKTWTVTGQTNQAIRYTIDVS